MFNLIMKDYMFTKKQALIAIAYCLAVPALLILDGGDKLYWAQFFIPFCLTTFLLGKISFKEDATDVRYFLKLLPYNVYKRVGARYCFMLTTLVVSEIYLWVLQYVVFKQPIAQVAKGNVIPIIIFLLYFSLYITLSYCFDYFTAQNSIYGCMVIAGILVIAYEKLDFNINFAALATSSSLIILSALSIGIIFLLFFLACIGDEKKGT